VKRKNAFPTYTDAIGKDCGIIGAELVTVAAIMKPIFSKSKEGGNVIIKYTKGPATGIQMPSKRGAVAEFRILAVVPKGASKTRSPASWQDRSKPVCT